MADKLMYIPNDVMQKYPSTYYNELLKRLEFQLN